MTWQKKKNISFRKACCTVFLGPGTKRTPQQEEMETARMNLLQKHKHLLGEEHCTLDSAVH